jgi:DNA-binding transcriptional ArsR family regulator
MTTATKQQIVCTPCNLFSILSRSDSLRMFVMAKDGLKISPSVIDKLNISPKVYYRSLKQLRDAGLVEKKKDNAGIIRYFHTTFGSIVYQRNIVEMDHYMENLEKMQMIDTIRGSEKFSEAGIARLIHEIMDNIVERPSSSFPSVISQSTKQHVDITLSFDNMVQILLDQIECCKNEILISTRICPEKIINKLLEKSKLGVKLKVIADTDLVKEYLRSQQNFVDNLDKENPMEERKCVVANPWFPDNSVNRRIGDIPFGMIIFDSSVVGIELVNSNNPKEFCGGIFIRDEKIAMNMTELYEQIWERASENIDITKWGHDMLTRKN